ncbi:MAG: D-glycero-beta-D-manno-heptose-7-phosphate kinase [Flammeovirgaceae bacterium]
MKVLVVGDVMIDSYVWGNVSRISPEAPVPIVNVKKQEKRLGGAANVAQNILSLGAKPVLCAVVGADNEAKTFIQILQQQGMTSEGILESTDRVTTIKHRILAGSQQLLRIDSEHTHLISENTAHQLFQQIKKLSEGANAIIFEDYDKGVLSEPLIQEVIGYAQKKGIPTIVDPKKRNFLSYKGASLFKPNLKELKEGLHIELNEKELIPSLKSAVAKLQEKMPTEKVMVTLSEYGVYITDNQQEHHIPAHRREIADVSGAGDTVVSIAALCLAANLSLYDIANLANLGGGIVCEHLGVVPIEKQRLMDELRKMSDL